MDKTKPYFSATLIKREQYFTMKQPHFHPHYELYYLISGKRRFFVNDTIYEFEKGSLIIINKGELHRTTYVSSETHERFSINFTETDLSPLIDEFSESVISNLFSRPYIILPPHLRPYIEDIMRRIYSEYISDDIFSDYIAKKHFQELLLYIIRYQQTLEDYDYTTSIQNENNAPIHNVVKYIRTNFLQNITLPEAAKLANMSPSYFSKKFKETTSFGFKEYIVRIRIAEASKMLIETNDSITSIALSCGFSDSNYFGDVFKKTKGLSPLQYRKNKELF